MTKILITRADACPVFKKYYEGRKKMTLDALRSQILGAFPDPDYVDSQLLFNLCMTAAKIAGDAYEAGYNLHRSGADLDFPFSEIRLKLVEEL